MLSRSLLPIVCLSALAAIQTSCDAAALVKRDGIEPRSTRKHSGAHSSSRKHATTKKKHPHGSGHKHPHPHPHPHPSGAAAPGQTSLPTTTPTATATSVAQNPTPGPPQPPKQQIVCDFNNANLNRLMINVPYNTYASYDYTGPEPYYRLTFTDANSKLKSVGENDANIVAVDSIPCASSYMQYSIPPPSRRRRSMSTEETEEMTLERRNAYYSFGLLRIPAYNDACIIATNPGNSPTSFAVAPCSYDDDASQVAQYFAYGAYDGESYAQYLGATKTDAVYPQGLGYKLDTSSIGTNNEVMKNIIATQRNSDDSSFYFRQNH